MIFTLKNVGPIKQAEIDLSHDLTIFTGPNNTGKTSVNYEIVELFSSSLVGIGIQALDSVIQEISTSNQDEKILNLDNQKLRIILQGICSKNTSLILKEDYINNRLLSFSEASTVQLFQYEAFVSKKNDSYLVSINFNKSVEEKEINDFLQNFIIIYLAHKIIKEKSYFFPAERIATATFGFQQTSGNLSNFNKDLYPWAILQHMDMVSQDKLIQHNNPLSDFNEFAIKLENILGGKFVRQQTGADVFIPEGTKTELGVAFTGSMVKSMHALVNYFRRRAQHGDFIILDEPEMNLHPDKQVEMAKLIVEWVYAGFKVLISTHSNYILRELNNLILLGDKPNSNTNEELCEKYGYTKEHLLPKENVGVHFFVQPDNGTVEVRPIEWSEYGFDVETIDKAIYNQNTRTDEILYSNDD